MGQSADQHEATGFRQIAHPLCYVLQHPGEPDDASRVSHVGPPPPELGRRPPDPPRP